MLGLLSPLSTASWTALPRNAPGACSKEFGRIGKLPRASPSIGPSLCLAKPPSNAKTTLPVSTPTTIGDFTYLMQPLDILRTFILYYLWFERCRKHFDNNYSLNKVLQQAWVATVEVGMATWKAIRAPRLNKDLDIQDRIELAFKSEWLHFNIFGSDNATIRWRFLPPLYFSNFDND
jgi:hypothetical protein